MIAAWLATLALQGAAPAVALHELTGRLVDPDGAPIALTRFDLVPLDGQRAPGVCAQSELDGTFRFAGFRDVGIGAGRWSAKLQRWGAGLEDVPLEPESFVVPGPPVVLTARVAHLSTGPGFEQAFCVQVPDLERGILERSEGWRFEDSRMEWCVRRDARCVVGNWSRTHGLRELEHVFADDDPWGALVLPELPDVAAEPGTVEFAVPGVRTNERLELQVLAPRSRFELTSVRADAGGNEHGRNVFRASLPPGDYLLRLVESDPALVCPMPGDSSWERRVVRPIERAVHVASGARLQLEADWERGERPTLAFDAPGARAVFVWELDAEGRLTRPVGCEPEAYGLFFGDLLGWPADGSARAAREPLPLGRVRLVAGADGYAPRTFELDVVEGAPCELRIELSARER